MLLIARHGNTFDPGDLIRRVGKGTDIPLSISGVEQARQLGCYLKAHHDPIHTVYTSTLKRTYMTAKIALGMMSSNLQIKQNTVFDEIDYGPDEGKPELEVIKRVGKQALLEWDQQAIPPEGWFVEPEKIKEQWRIFAASLLSKTRDQCTLVVTSNGVARFAHAISSHANQMVSPSMLKLSTGALACFTYDGAFWRCDYWNRRPDEFL